MSDEQTLGPGESPDKFRTVIEQKTHLQIAQWAYHEWLTLLDGVLADSEAAFEEFSAHGRDNLADAGKALARAEQLLRQSRELIAAALSEEDL